MRLTKKWTGQLTDLRIPKWRQQNISDTFDTGHGVRLIDSWRKIYKNYLKKTFQNDQIGMNLRG